MRYKLSGALNRKTKCKSIKTEQIYYTNITFSTVYIKMKKEIIKTIAITYIPGLGTWQWVCRSFAHVEPVTLICVSNSDNFYIVEEKVQYENTKDYANITKLDKGCIYIYNNLLPLCCHTVRLTQPTGRHIISTCNKHIGINIIHYKYTLSQKGKTQLHIKINSYIAQFM